MGELRANAARVGMAQYGTAFAATPTPAKRTSHEPTCAPHPQSELRSIQLVHPIRTADAARASRRAQPAKRTRREPREPAPPLAHARAPGVCDGRSRMEPCVIECSFPLLGRTPAALVLSGYTGTFQLLRRVGGVWAHNRHSSTPAAFAAAPSLRRRARPCRCRCW